MQASTVAMIVSGLEAAAIAVWVDGGWCIDALLGRQSRPHSDLDLAVDRRNVERLCGWLAQHGYVERPWPDATPWNFVLADESGGQTDVHVFEFRPAEPSRLTPVGLAALSHVRGRCAACRRAADGRTGQAGKCSRLVWRSEVADGVGIEGVVEVEGDLP